ncbi:MAG: hypothetical protein GF411_20175 [Candidatus Lokiarchaeota archaeon]|nr:hypothetical protein [Candidatus Lokiarchaeota archaeon]
MKDHNIQAILITDKGGVPLFFMKLDPKAVDIDPYLVSGFFAALSDFSDEVIEEQSQIFQIDYGARLFTVLPSEESNLIAVSINEWQPEVTPILKTLIIEFEHSWLNEIQQDENESEQLVSRIPGFRESIVQKLAFQHISAKWIPFLETSSSPEKLGPIGSFIDGKTTIEKIIARSGLPSEQVLDEVARLWSMKSIRFRNMLDEADIVVETSNMRKLLQYSSPERDELENKDPELVALIPRLASLIDGKTSVGNIINQIVKHHDKQTIHRALDYLLDVGAIEALSPEKRRILVVKHSLDLVVETAQEFYSPSMIASKLETVLSGVSAPEVTGEIKIFDGSIQINYEFELYEGLDPNRVMDLYAEWISTIARFTSSLEKEKIQEFVGVLIMRFKDQLIPFYQPDDLRGLEEFSYYLEMLTAQED